MLRSLSHDGQKERKVRRMIQRMIRRAASEPAAFAAWISWLKAVGRRGYAAEDCLRESWADERLDALASRARRT